PKLWPRVSPNKTWAGSGGAVGLSLVVALAVAWLGWGRRVPVLILAVAVSIVAQLGDLFESALKRRFGVKDSSQIIPGHGGLLDRFDAMLGGALVLSLATALAGLPQGFA
ncbi:phosphatidate cytidylyltransferase, partial [Pontibaca methylaminivorans]|uniref:phosphatidate cytidylyltransferase n=1 Tax=Pontibaca methylaminivorans TaxID=515897 RepID=UPI002FDAF366